MKKIILIFTISAIILIIFKSLYDSIPSPPPPQSAFAPFLGFKEASVPKDDDDSLISRFDEIQGKTDQCTVAKTKINQDITKMRPQLEKRITANQEMLNECKKILPGRVDVWKKHFQKVNKRTATKEDLDNIVYAPETLIPRF